MDFHFFSINGALSELLLKLMANKIHHATEEKKMTTKV